MHILKGMTQQAADGRAVAEVYELLRLAIRRRQPVAAVYDEQKRLLCPHVLGRKSGRLRVLCYQFGGGSHSAAGEAAGWRCLAVDKLRQVEWCEASWHTGPRPGLQTCVDEVDLDTDAQREQAPQ